MADSGPSSIVLNKCDIKHQICMGNGEKSSDLGFKRFFWLFYS